MVSQARGERRGRCAVAGQGGQAGWCFPGLDVRGPRHFPRETLIPLD